MDSNQAKTIMIIVGAVLASIVILFTFQKNIVAPTVMNEFPPEILNPENNRVPPNTADPAVTHPPERKIEIREVVATVKKIEDGAIVIKYQFAKKEALEARIFIDQNTNFFIKTFSENDGPLDVDATFNDVSLEATVFVKLSKGVDDPSTHAHEIYILKHDQL